MDCPTPPHGLLRADEALAQQGLVESRAAAQRLIREGKARRENGDPVTKPSQKIPANEPLSVPTPPRYVSRGGDKLAAWFSRFPHNLTGLPALDIGASTGGFTDCLLQLGATSVDGIDVGRGQLHPRLQADPRVTCREGVNARDLDQVELPRTTYPVVVADLSFISLTKVLTPLWNRVALGGLAVLLVKPQFEAPREAVARSKGIIRDDETRESALANVREHALALPGAYVQGVMECPVAGGDGNREFLLGLTKA